MDQPGSSGSERIPERLAEVDYVIAPSRHPVREIPPDGRPREAMDRLGAEHLRDRDLLAIVLRSGARGLNVVDLAEALLRRYGSFAGMASASVEELRKFKGVGRVKAQVLAAALEIGRRLPERGSAGASVRNPEDAARLLRAQAQTLEHEVFWTLLLDAKNRLKCKPIAVTSGLLDASLVHPREVFQQAIRQGAAALVLAHNHPSGDPTPSAEDVRITRQLIDSGRIVDIKVMDHVILGRPGDGWHGDYVSLREQGLVNFST